MFGLSFFEILFLAVLALIVIGPKQLPEVAKMLGRFMRDLRRTTNLMTDEFRQNMYEPPAKTSQPPPAVQPAPTQNLPAAPAPAEKAASVDQGTKNGT